MTNDYPNLTWDMLNVLFMHMADDIREDLHNAAGWEYPGEFLTAYMALDPDFPIHEFEWIIDAAGV